MSLLSIKILNHTTSIFGQRGKKNDLSKCGGHQNPKLPHDFFVSRVKLSLFNGSSTTTYIGTLAEVMNGYVDASISAFRPTLERLQLVDFSQTLVESKLTIVTKTPAKSDTVSYITRKQYK